MKAINTLLVVAILLFATVMTWTYFAVHGSDSSSLPTAGIGGGPGENTADTAFRDQFLTLLPQHGNLAATHLINLYDGKDTSTTSRRLESNAYQLADVIKQLGTSADRAVFLQAFRGHIKEYENYTQALKNNNPVAMNTAKENLRMHAMEFGDLANKLMPTISKTRGTQLMTDHISLTLAIIDDHAKGDNEKLQTDKKNATMQAEKFAEELARGANQASK
jgi:hypothetical protein